MKNLGGDGSGVFGYERYLESRCCFSEPLQCLKMPFPTHVIVTLDKEGSFSAPPKEFREKIMAALKVFFVKNWRRSPGVMLKTPCGMLCSESPSSRRRE